MKTEQEYAKDKESSIWRRLFFAILRIRAVVSRDLNIIVVVHLYIYICYERISENIMQPSAIPNNRFTRERESKTEQIHEKVREIVIRSPFQSSLCFGCALNLSLPSYLYIFQRLYLAANHQNGRMKPEKNP